MVDPTNWAHDYDATVEVGLGYGDKEQAIFNMGQVLMLQEKAASNPGTAYLATPDKMFAAVSEMLKNMGYKNAERFFNNPASTPPPPPEPSPEEKKLAHEAWLKLKELEVRELGLRLDYEVEMAKLGINVKAMQQPDPVPPPPAIQMDLGLGPVLQDMGVLKQAQEQLAGEVVNLRDVMRKPRRVVRDAEGRPIGSELAE
jgi:hypothetical protein